MLSINQCTKRFDKHNVIDNLTINLYNEKTALLGENGSGKTTLIRMIVGLSAPDKGVIKIDEKDLYEHPRERRKIGYVPAEDFFYEKLTVEENLKLISSLYGVKLNRKDIQKIAKETQIIEYLDMTVSDLSSGMRKKVSLTSALLHDPEFLILDEPFNALDIFASALLSNILKNWPKGVLFTSHIPETIFDLADRVIILKNGSIQHDEKISSFKTIHEFNNWLQQHISIKK
jgi:ABC-2 type transport system ATP-binding protein